MGKNVRDEKPMEADSSSETIKVAAAQCSGHVDREVNVETATRLVREAASLGAQIICLPELFNTIYFCVEEHPKYFDWAEPIPGPTITRMSELAKEVRAVLICPIFEHASNGKFYNSAAVVGPDGDIIGKYRKTHIPFMDRQLSPEPRGNEKFYFEPGDLGFPTFDTPFGVRIGILICYDRHFPEGARALALNGTEIMFAPTASSKMNRYLWDLELRAHAVANIYYVCGVNKVNVDVGGSTRYHAGDSLICDPRGEVLTEAGDANAEVVVAELDLSVIRKLRRMWGYYSDRRPDLYHTLTDASPSDPLAQVPSLREPH